MLFSSITFLGFFLPAVLLVYYALPSRNWRNGVLLLASLFFYAWGEPKFVLLMLASIAFNYNAGLWISRAERRGRVLLLAVAANLAALFAFKYLGFSVRIIDSLFGAMHIPLIPAPELALPLGISFYTFQSISYLADVYRRPESVERSALNLGLYIAFFPQLVAGPIVRHGDLAPQITSRGHSAGGFSEGLERFMKGLAKKVLLANSFARVCDNIYGADFFSYGTAEAWTACLAYSLQIYYDFSGYSDMAIGLARMFGFRLPENFDHPYAAASITEFWRRWHMTLTAFFREHVYIPLGGNRRGRLRTAANRLLVFLLTGIWHGASYNFVLWGLGHGLLMSAERAVSGILGRTKAGGILRATLGRAFTLLCVALLWVLFRNGTALTAKLLLKMFGVNYTAFRGEFRAFVPDDFLLLSIDARFWILAAAGILLAFPWWRKIPFPRGAVATAARRLVLLVLLALSWASLAAGSYNPFIYFRF